MCSAVHVMACAYDATATWRENDAVHESVDRGCRQEEETRNIVLRLYSVAVAGAEMENSHV